MPSGLYIVLCTVFFLPYLSSSAQADLEILTHNFSGANNSSKIRFSLVFKNNSPDTLAIIKPRAELFLHHFQEISSTDYKNQVSLPYELILYRNGKEITEPELETPPAAQGKKQLLTEEDLIYIPPNSQTEDLYLWLYSEYITFNKQDHYEFQVKYCPSFKQLSASQKKLLKIFRLYQQNDYDGASKSMVQLGIQKLLEEDHLIQELYAQESTSPLNHFYVYGR